MSAQPQIVTDELKAWIIDQARAGCRPEAVLASMCASGWNEDVAAQALEATLSAYLGAGKPIEVLPPPLPVPEPDLISSNKSKKNNHFNF